MKTAKIVIYICCSILLLSGIIMFLSEQTAKGTAYGKYSKYGEISLSGISVILMSFVLFLFVFVLFNTETFKRKKK